MNFGVSIKCVCLVSKKIPLKYSMTKVRIVRLNFLHLLNISLDWERIKRPLLRVLRYIREEKLKEELKDTFKPRLNHFFKYRR